MAIAVALALLVSAVAPAEPVRHSQPGAVASANVALCFPNDADDETHSPAGGHRRHECVSCLPCGVSVAIIDSPMVASLVVPPSTQVAWQTNDAPPRGRRAYARLGTGPPSLS